MLNATKRAQANIGRYKESYKVVKKTTKLVRRKVQINVMARVLRAVLCKKLMASLKSGAVKTKYLNQCEVSRFKVPYRNCLDSDSDFPKAISDPVQQRCGAKTLRLKA